MITSCTWLFFFSSRRRHTRCSRDWSSDVCSSDLINGGQQFGYEVTVEGISIDSGYITAGNTDFTPTLESISEFKLEVVPNASSSGGGSAVINYAIKSGGNDFHGTVWEFNTNSAYDSKGTAANFAGQAKP